MITDLQSQLNTREGIRLNGFQVKSLHAGFTWEDPVLIVAMKPLRMHHDHLRNLPLATIHDP